MSESSATPPAAQEAEAKRAMEMKSAAPDVPHPGPGQTAGKGMNPTPNATIAPSGALNAEGQEMKSAAPDVPHPGPGQTAGKGMNPTPNATIAPSGALNAEGQRPVLERSRKVR